MKTLLTLLILLGVTVCEAQDMVVVVHPETKIDGLSRKDLKNIYLGKKKQWPGGASVVPLGLSEENLQEQFLKEYLKNSKRQFDTYWQRMIFTGQGIPPKTLPDEAEMLRMVLSTPGAVGYVRRQALKGDVKIVKLD